MSASPLLVILYHDQDKEYAAIPPRPLPMAARLAPSVQAYTFEA
jgi:hypothetical protein